MGWLWNVFVVQQVSFEEVARHVDDVYKGRTSCRDGTQGIAGSETHFSTRTLFPQQTGVSISKKGHCMDVDVWGSGCEVFVSQSASSRCSECSSEVRFLYMGVPARAIERLSGAALPWKGTLGRLPRSARRPVLSTPLPSATFRGPAMHPVTQVTVPCTAASVLSFPSTPMPAVLFVHLLFSPIAALRRPTPNFPPCPCPSLCWCALQPSTSSYKS